MFTIIRPEERAKKSALLSKIKKTREDFCEGSLLQEDAIYDTPSTIYIAYEKEKWGVFASARINLLTDSPAAACYQKTFAPEAFQHIRELTLVSFEIHEDHWASENLRFFEHAIREFYQDLRNVLINLSVAHGWKGLVTLTDRDDHSDFAFFGGWPLITVQPLMLNKNTLIIGELPIDTYDRSRSERTLKAVA